VRGISFSCRVGRRHLYPRRPMQPELNFTTRRDDPKMDRLRELYTRLERDRLARKAEMEAIGATEKRYSWEADPS